MRHGHGRIAWPYVSEELIFGLVLGRVTPHSIRYNLLIDDCDGTHLGTDSRTCIRWGDHDDTRNVGAL